MLSTNQPDSSTVQFNSIEKETVSILDEYLCKNIKSIPLSVRYRIINKFEYNTLSFIESYQRNFPDNSDTALAIDRNKYRSIAKIYLSLISYMRALQSNRASKTNFERRCELLSGILPIEKEGIERYMDYSTLNFHMFGCIYEIIFERLKLSEWRRRILINNLDYSNKYEKLTKEYVGRMGKVADGTVYAATVVVKRMIHDVIKNFKVLTPYCSYESKYLCNAEVIKIDDKMADRICKDEGVEGITPCLAAKVLSVIYNYKLIVDGNDGSEEYLLIREKAETGKSNSIEKHTAARKMQLAK